MQLTKYLCLLLLPLLILGSCAKDSCKNMVTYTKYTPFYVPEDDLHQEVSVESPRVLEEPGKIYFYNNYIFINEKRKGIHVIDNSEPAAPTPVAFLGIPGNIDLAIKSGILYADSYLDLLSIDISTPEAATLINRVERVVPPLFENQGQYLLYYEEELVTEERDCSTGGGFWGGEDVVFSQSNSGVAASSSGSIPGAGIGGSFARFTLYGNNLYTVSNTDLNVFDISAPVTPTLVNTIQIGWDIETIFPYEDNLFIGSNAGMYIFDNSNPAEPVLLSEFQHANACDPVFVDGDYAYVTLRSGDDCQGFTNQLDLIDITELTNPVLIESFPMTNPHGLSKSGDMLFVCEGEHGLKAFNAAVPEELNHNLTAEFKGFATYDAISLSNGLLMVIGADGLYQFDFSDPNELRQISVIQVIK